MSWPPWWQIKNLHWCSNWGSGYQIFFYSKMYLKNLSNFRIWIGTSESKYWNKIKYSKYLKHNNPIQTVVRLYSRYLSLNHPINNLSVKLDDGIHGNDIIMFGVAVMENFNLISVVITTNRKIEIMVFIRRIIPKWW